VCLGENGCSAKANDNAGDGTVPADREEASIGCIDVTNGIQEGGGLVGNAA
jgi:hypothetical protein